MKKTIIKDVEFLNLKATPDDVDEEIDVERAGRPADTDSAEVQDASEAIGRNLARLRLAAGLDVAMLAERTGIRTEQLELIESGQGLPGLRGLLRLAAALSVPFGALLDDTMRSEASDAEFRVQRASEGRVVASIGGLQSRVLWPRGIAGAPEVYELALRGGGAETAERHGPATCEHIIVTAGVMVVQVGEKQVELGVGDSLFFRADVPHRYLNPAAAEARALLLMVYA